MSPQVSPGQLYGPQPQGPVPTQSGAGGAAHGGHPTPPVPEIEPPVPPLELAPPTADPPLPDAPLVVAFPAPP